MRHFRKNLFHLNNSKRICRIGMTLFIAYLALSAVESIWSVYIEHLLGNDAYVGFTISFFTIVSFLSFFLIVPIIEKNDKLFLISLAYLITAVIYILFYFNKNFSIFVLLALIVTILTTIRVSSSGILIEKNSTRKSLSKNEGFVYTLFNLSYFIGPIIAFVIDYYFGLNFVFLASSFFLFLALYILKSSKVNHGGKKKKLDNNPIKNFFDFFKSRDRIYSYLLGGGVNFWWSLIYVFIPLYIIKNLPDIWVGIFLALVVVPLILFEYYFSKKVSEKGYKKYFFIGFMIPCIISLLCFLFYNVWFILPILIVASIGLSMLEPTTESYFFDILKSKEDQRFYSPYNTAINFGSFFGQIIPSIVLLFFDFRFIFLVFFFGTLLLSLLSLIVREVIEKRRKGCFT